MFGVSVELLKEEPVGAVLVAVRSLTGVRIVPGRRLLYALSISGQAKAEGILAALDLSLKHQPLLERIRKYDDHADAYHNGGFFFWYDQYGRAIAAKSVSAAAALAKQREIVLQIPEIDGCWVDSHELGRVYGTAMALLTLKLCEN